MNKGKHEGNVAGSTGQFPKHPAAAMKGDREVWRKFS